MTRDILDDALDFFIGSDCSTCGEPMLDGQNIALATQDNGSTYAHHATCHPVPWGSWTWGPFELGALHWLDTDDHWKTDWGLRCTVGRLSIYVTWSAE